MDGFLYFYPCKGLYNMYKHYNRFVLKLVKFLTKHSKEFHMTKQTKDVQTVIDELATKGVEALDAMANFTQEQVDHIVHQAAIAALDKHMYLAKLAVDETGRGIYEDKAIKNMYASEYIWNSIKYDKPVGVICGVTPTTNPTSTTIFKALIAL
ncbi:hypothetical protein STHE1630_01618 [Streptococcus thermophilus CNCM I-1630]|nr:hypothetical protein STHE1630_01618 [Streptococcus thermophilus CNCM I-1630]